MQEIDSPPTYTGLLGAEDRATHDGVEPPASEPETSPDQHLASLPCPVCKQKNLELIPVEEHKLPYHLVKCASAVAGHLMVKTNAEGLREENPCTWTGPACDALEPRPINQAEVEIIFHMFESWKSLEGQPNRPSEQNAKEFIASNLGISTAAVETVLANADAIKAGFAAEEAQAQEAARAQVDQQMQDQVNRLCLDKPLNLQPPHVLAATSWAQSTGQCPSALKLSAASQLLRDSLGFTASDGEEKIQMTQDIIAATCTMFAQMDGYVSAALAPSDLNVLRVALFHEHRSSSVGVFGAAMEMWVLAHRVRYAEIEAQEQKRLGIQNQKRIIMPGEAEFEQIRGEAGTDGAGNVVPLDSRRRGTGRGRR